MNKIYKVGGLFSGVGGIELGFANQENFKIAWGTDFDVHASKTYRKNFSHPFHEIDINKLKGKDLEEVDVLVAGFPCQPFSVAGYQKGFEDERGDVFFQIIRVINELSKKPDVLLLENVKNIYTHDKGKTFRIIQESLKQTGYYVLSKIMNTCNYTNVPQNRERTFIMCFLKGKNYRTDYLEKSFLSKRKTELRPVSDFLTDSIVDEKYYYREDKYNYNELVASITKRDTFYQWRRVYVRENKSGVCPTLTANMGTGGHNVPLIKDDYGIRKLTPRECFNLQGFPENFKLPKQVSNTQLYKQAGNSVTVDMFKKLSLVIYNLIK
tara:strand:+ start:277 stop:1248 length:972 start_codon:yes stop_codon:yes gene_type:complete